MRAAFADTGPSLDAAPAGDVTYFASAALPASAPRPGSLLTIESSGDEVPAFRSTLVVPPPLVLDAPSEVRSTNGAAPYEPVEMLVGTEQDLELRFANAPDGVRLMIDTTPTGGVGDGTLVACDLEIRKGAVVIPASALDAGRHRELRLIAATVEDLHAGDWSVKAALGGEVWAKIAVGQSESLVPLTLRVQ